MELIKANTDRSGRSNKTSMLLWVTFSFAELTAAVVGCGGSTEKKEVYSVSGSLLINGNPAADAWVTLAPDTEGVPIPMGRVEKDGSFQLTVYDQDLAKYQKRGNPAGEYHVLVRLPKDPAMPLSPDRLGGSYADPRRFEHVVTIDMGENTLEPIRIDNAKVLN